MFRYLILVNLFLIFTESRPNWHSSQISLNQLFNLQKEHFDVFKDYLDLETKRLEVLKNHLESIYEWRNFTLTEQYIQIHINGFKVITRIHQYLCKIEALMNNKQSLNVLNIINKDTKVVNKEHVILAYQAIRRLQNFYKISAFEMSTGTFNERKFGNEMDACECYIMSKYSFEKYDMYGVSEWANVTFNKWIIDGQPSCVDIDQLYFYAISSSMYTGFDFSSLFNSNINNHLKDTKNIAQFLSLNKNNMFTGNTRDIMDRYNPIEYYDNHSINLCKYGKSTRILTKDSVCQYNSMNSHYRILMPFKEEHISDNPHLKIYHDVLYDNEITKIKYMAMNLMNESTVANNNVRLMNELIRSSQTARFNKEVEAEHFNSLNTRIESITAFSTMSAEDFQVVNYGLGGHFIPHYDSFYKNEIKNEFEKKNGNRLVTVLFYLNDVPNDGYTLFPRLNFITSPEKGAAVVWYNLHLSNGNINEKTLHAACPILKGNKWIMTRWIHELGQDLPYNWKL